MQVAHCYPTILESYPQEIIDVLQTYNTVLDNEMRLVSEYYETITKFSY